MPVAVIGPLRVPPTPWMEVRVRRIHLAVVLLVALTALALGGCKNACEKAVNKMIDCMSAYCEDHADSSECEHMAEAGDGIAAEAASRMGDCSGETQAMAEAMNAMECEQIMTTFMAGREPPPMPEIPEVPVPEVPT